MEAYITRNGDDVISSCKCGECKVTLAQLSGPKEARVAWDAHWRNLANMIEPFMIR